MKMMEVASDLDLLMSRIDFYTSIILAALGLVFNINSKYMWTMVT